MDRRLWITIGVAAALVPAPVIARGFGGGGTAPPKPDWNAVADPVKAAQIALRDVCLPAVIEGRPIEPIAKSGRFTRTPPKAVQAGPSDSVWQVGSVARVYVVARADGSCSALVSSGPADLLRPAVEAAILDRPEGFTRRQARRDAHLERSAYCAAAGDTKLLVSLAIAGAGAPRGARVLSADVSRVPGYSPECDVVPAGG